jgi:hypothetical protein
MATAKLDFINLAFGGATALKDQNSAFPQDFAVTGRPEYGTAMEWLKAADHFRGVTYGNKRSLDFYAGSEHLSDRIKTGTVIGLLAIPQYSWLMGLEVRVDAPMRDAAGALVTGAAAKFMLATTGEVLATVPLDAAGAKYFDLADLVGERYTDYGNDAIEMELVAIPADAGVDDEFVCVPLVCENGFSLCLSTAVNFINNAIEPRCQAICEDI